MKNKVFISACLLGDKCRYNSKILDINPKIKKLSYYIKGCPEQIGGLPIPRKKSFIVGGTGRDVLSGTAKVIDETYRDVTKEFLKGATAVLSIVKKNTVKKAYLKVNSPSCGKDGVTAALLKKHDIKIDWIK
ncbi:MAG: hypothetical protein A2252_04735 [Elusimicrobia bacterium RIFOXYA2_FULL_39_19]|nr:MAG: hypothetical protein A2252_04735 [Elusimicrobia bacterium RIFOXYA2_FULL_39_19]